MPIPTWIAERMEQNVEQLAARGRESVKQHDFKLAVNELMRDFNVVGSKRVEFINAVCQSAVKILK